MINISPVAFAARKGLRALGIILSHGHALELTAAVLSYRTFAALQAEERNSVSPSLGDAGHIVLQQDVLTVRLRDLGLASETQAVVFDVLSRAFEGAEGVWQSGAQIHRSFEDLKDHLAQDTQTRAWTDDGVISAYAETNAYVDEFYTDSYEFDGSLFDVADCWCAVLAGTHTGEQDPDRVYYGHRGDFEATYSFDKAGRCGLIETDFSIRLSFEQDYGEDGAS
ncbi:hypothetical protein MNR01_05940 [Lysobacter sp. S4-A87]|uniref:hypothetical protein n=1 Tax=Lysobacter sp. S4-A87 TaxID=2925843 RepID=UPI001F53353B|nr:hypothetical protein [Lysobacter sp. S4-A87]UNK50545.1 hypothetical protein MNR01_05940 [Lysobacter sp. S4-A87]